MPATGVVVLVVDDEPSNLNVMRCVLERQGHTVITAQGCDDALEDIRRLRNVDLLIADVLLKVGNGIELARTLQSINPDLKILLTSGWGDDRIVELLAESNFQHTFLPKPFTASQFVSAVLKVLARLSKS